MTLPANIEQIEAATIDSLLNNFCSKYQVNRSQPQQFQLECELDAEDHLVYTAILSSPIQHRSWRVELRTEIVAESSL